MNAETLRAWWWHKQGLDGSLAGASAATLLERVGWMRSVGGAGPYLGLHARAGLRRADVDAAVARTEVSELPSARGCTYVLPAVHFGLGLRAGQGFGDDAAITTAKKHLGVTDAELVALETAVIEALEGRALDPRALKEILGDRVRGLGADGKKRGQTTTLPLALGRLQSHGRIRRVPLDGRLDRQRYAYTVWESNPIVGNADPYVALARLYFGWIGPATAAHFQWFSGLGVKAAKAAMEPLGLVDVGEGRMLLPGDLAAFRSFAAPGAPQVRFLSNVDGLLLHRREVAPLLDEADAARPMWTEKGPQAGGALTDMENQPIVDRGRIIGVWDYDGVRGELVWRTFASAGDDVRAEASRMEDWIRADLGDVRTFSLDSPESRGARLEAIRAR